MTFTRSSRSPPLRAGFSPRRAARTVYSPSGVKPTDPGWNGWAGIKPAPSASTSRPSARSTGRHSKSLCAETYRPMTVGTPPGTGWKAPSAASRPSTRRSAPLPSFRRRDAPSEQVRYERTAACVSAHSAASTAAAGPVLASRKPVPAQRARPCGSPRRAASARTVVVR